MRSVSSRRKIGSKVEGALAMSLNSETTKERKDVVEVGSNKADTEKFALIKTLADELYESAPSGACQNCQS